MMKRREEYLGDGLYASDDGFMIILRAPREESDHWVGLESDVIERFLRFIEEARGVKITIERVERNAE